MTVIQEHNLDFNLKNMAKAIANEENQLSPDDFKKFYEQQNRYEQWGGLMGSIHIEGKEDQELYMWSCRTRIQDSLLSCDRFSITRMFMYFQDGFPIKIENLSIQHFFKNYTNGYTINDLGGANEIQDCTLEDNMVNLDPSKIAYSFKISRSNKYVNKNVTLDFGADKEVFYIGSDLEVKVIIRQFEIFLDAETKGIGVMYRTEKPNESMKRDLIYPPLLLKDSGKICRDESVIPLTNEMAKSSLITGGKGCSLSLLTSLSRKDPLFEVPRGFVITTAAFDKHIKANPSANFAIQRVVKVSSNKISGDLKEECDRCTKEFQKTKLDENLKIEIKEMLSRVYDTSVSSLRFSIRSSACDEDSEDYSAAGQMLTVLGVRGLENIYKSIVECWSSKFGYEAVQYTRQSGKLIRSPMAVVVQEMIPSEISGVLFTVDPVTGNPSRPHITANYGLGETVVSSLAEPDTIVLKRINDSLEVETKTIGAKQTQVHMTDEYGTEQKEFENEIEAACLSDEWAIMIGKAGILVENCFCSPQDIEWACYKNKLYLLQARPITTLHTETEFEMTHDQDTPMKSCSDYWTRANVGEVYLGAMSPLGISTVTANNDIYSLRNRFIRELSPEKDFCPYLFHILPVTHRQVALNIINVLFRANDKEISNFQKSFEVALFGRLIGTEEMHKAGIKKHGYMTRIQRLIGLPYIFVFAYLVPKWAEQYEKKLRNYQLPLESFTSVEKTWNAIMGQMKFINEVTNVHGMATFLSSFYNLWVLNILSRKKKDWDNEVYSDFSTLLSACANVESADVPENLQELARIIAKQHGSTFSSLSPNMAYNVLENDTSLAGVLFKEFLRKHGHRCIKEFDIYSESWGMNPENLMPILQSMVISPNILNPQHKEEMTVETAISKVKAPVSGIYRKILKFVLPWCRNAVRRREKTKSMVIKTLDWLRKTVSQLAEMMVQEEMLPSKDLLYFLTLGEVDELIRYRKSGLVSKAIRRKKLHPKLDNLTFPEIITGIPKPVEVKEDMESLSKSSFTITGTPVCQGKVRGTARVIKSFSEVSQIQNGDILITYSTDIGWTPYFPLLSGVVTVLGGLISHGAVIAREYGLPCIVGAQNALSVFKSGDIVLLDGTKGTITKLEILENS
ncbi:rifampicin phosphotransferase [Parasteatoda tepidariorum]|uniref:rifampicin phosphotransferase n=1 Tax=Parasteatoda tepidariorum TaxID=114398 RepID=UPI001C72402C|nr:putative phosphoenolpyruvate synthase [Parasteatoda tepidariorum]